MSSYSLSPYRLPHILSPARSTPSLDDNLDDNFFSPPENHLDTPDLNSFDWKEIRRLEDHKLYLEEREAASLALYDFELPSLEEVSPGDTSLGLGLSSAPASWQPQTITPAEAFYDYDEVRRYLAEQARPSSPAYSVCSSYLATPYSDTKELPSIDGVSHLAYPVELPSPESAVLVSSPDISFPVPTAKRSREEVDDEDYHEDEDDDNSLASQRGRVSKRQRRKVGDFSDPDVGIPEREQSADDDDDEFKPRSLSIKRHGTNKKQNRRSQKPPVKTRSQPQSGADNSYRLGPCDCRQPNCANCEMTCFYTFIRGPRKGRVCKRLFESGRHLDLRRHKISHAVNEWQMLQDGEITLEEAWWYAVEHKCEYQGLICPNGDCKTTFTSVHVALQYLRLYSDNIARDHTLPHPSFEPGSMRGIMGCVGVYLPSKSVALERFVTERSEQSTHLALLTFWFMQASLNDLALTKRNTPSFLICQRVLHKCHEIIFGDIASPAPTPYSSLTIPSQSKIFSKKVKPYFEPAIVGIGCVLAGIPGLPQVAEEIGDVAIVQGQRENSMPRPRPAHLEDSETDGVMNVQKVEMPTSDQDQGTITPSDGEGEFDISPDALDNASQAVVTPNGGGMSSEFLALQNSSSLRLRKHDIQAARTTPALISKNSLGQSSRPVGGTHDHDSDFTTTTQPSHMHAHSHCLSTPAISDTKQSPNFLHLHSLDNLLQKYDLRSQRLLLRGHYLRSEDIERMNQAQFMLGLESIATKLLVVPRPARVSALRAELTNLNHRLPAEICLPLWCHTSDTPSIPNGNKNSHHRIVRIPPSEGVVLNSAERAPYLLIIEILHDDLDFDPSKRRNVEILRKIVSKDTGHVRSMSDPLDPKSTLGKSSIDPSGTVVSEIHTVPSLGAPSDTPDVEEEIDVVEQLYNSDLLAGDPDFAFDNFITIPSVPKNKRLDLEAWSKSSSGVPTSGLSQDALNGLTASLGGLQASTSISVVEGTGVLPKARTEALTLEEYSERMHTAAVMLAQLNANTVLEPVTMITPNGAPSLVTGVSQSSASAFKWMPGSVRSDSTTPQMRMRLQRTEAQAIRDRIMQEMLSLEEERMDRMRVPEENWLVYVPDITRGSKAADENIIRQELNKVDPSAIAFREPWAIKKKRIKASSPYGHLANWDCFSLIVKTGTDLRQEQLAVQLIREFGQIWKDENCSCWVRHFHILITGPSSGLVETITDALSIHSLKKTEYARRVAAGQLGYVSLFDYFKSTYGDTSSAKFARAQRNFAQSLAGYSLVTYLLQIKDRHNGNILIDKEGHILHIDFGFMFSNSPGNLGFEAAPFKLPYEYVEVLGGIDGEPFQEFKRLCCEGFEAARKHCDRIINSSLPCFTASKEYTSIQLRERFQTSLTHSLLEEHIERLIMTSLGSTWTRLYDSE
ncbi:hypothetical protein Clacol_006378 [Clathrus columnatus]|uniref:1-phosphatidylinositol 4-kinase n=1 Tax=Clathrus columnatus TaxID=1419009 RepID=A0AAV5ABW8_9AGAM|nr:hypothetical protein Clacol_006378 [Clathrus columnatus]